ncbi:hypothetical protein ACIQWZ_33095 [Streptomyces sp. NPDC098077]|uniref:hypothetical protein n=1 Tax=Streptomyces sp. NPDC098077 TaxID=3366093 RepID=UPI00381927F4
MDATEAALVGALGGAVLGAAGAWGAALIALRAARYQADRQADAQQQQWLRQVRRETYKVFLEAAEQCTSHMRIANISRELELNEEGMTEKQIRRDASNQDLRKFVEARAALNLEAPEEIRTKVIALAQEYSYLATFRAWCPSSPEILRADII